MPFMVRAGKKFSCSLSFHTASGSLSDELEASKAGTAVPADVARPTSVLLWPSTELPAAFICVAAGRPARVTYCQTVAVRVNATGTV